MKLHSTILGEGNPFLILHGFLGMSDNWKTLGGQFAELGYQVHLIDQRNHGRSPHSSDFSYDLMAEDLKEYCEQHNLKDIVLLGHSMGGKTAMFTAVKFSGLIDKLIVVDIAPKYYSPHHQKILSGMQAVDKAKLDSRGEADKVLAEYVKEKSVRQFLLKNLYWKEKGLLGLRLNIEVLSQAGEVIGEELPVDKRFSGSTLFVRGENSSYIETSDHARIAQQFPQSRIEAIQGAGHWVHAEKRVDFYKVVENYLK